MQEKDFGIVDHRNAVKDHNHVYKGGGIHFDLNIQSTKTPHHSIIHG